LESRRRLGKEWSSLCEESTSLSNGYKPFAQEGSQPIEGICITFDMNRLQAIPLPGEPGSPGRVLVSMNPIRTPNNPRSSQTYDHPIISSESVLASRRLPLINMASNISFAGAWMGYGFHEDGFVVGMQVAQKIITGKYEHRSIIKFGSDLADWVPKPSAGTTAVKRIVAFIQFGIENVEWLRW
jgi:hypothetical protein